jgi:FtsP/CotA-like multicopper oxidase with cupredoxin domain
MNLRGALFLAVGIALLAGLFVVFRPAGDAPPSPPAAESPEMAPPVAAPSLPLQPKVFELTVSGSKLTAGPDVIKVVVGDEVTLRVTADRADELHLHGYDLSLKLQPGVPAELHLLATRTGRFEYELHKAHVDLGALEVHPK